MRITKARLQEIIKEELEEVIAGKGYVPAGTSGLRWVGRDREKFPSAASAKRVFQKLVDDLQFSLSPSERRRAMMWIDRNWQKMPNREKAELEIKGYLEDIAK